jgi:hypothetical protein
MTTATRRARTSTTPAAREAKASAPANPRISLGSLWETKNENFWAGTPKGADARYANQAEFLSLLPAPPEGHSWRLKAFGKETKAGYVTEVIVEAEPDYRPEA